MDGGSAVISRGLPSGDFALHGFKIRDSAVEALAVEGA